MFGKKISDKDLLSKVRQLEDTVAKHKVEIHALNHYLDYLLLHPTYEISSGLGFNGQDGRKAIFLELLERCGFEQILETGTWMGNSTGFMASHTDIPILSCDLNERYNLIATRRLAGFDNITLKLLDSREFLKGLAKTDKTKKRTFIYLDAHWHSDLPLEEELEIIATDWTEAVIMIDDFKVPGDKGYKFDDYGPGKSLCLDTFGAVIKKYNYSVFIPSLASSKETGAKRGCIVLSNSESCSATLKTIKELKNHSL